MIEFVLTIIVDYIWELFLLRMVRLVMFIGAMVFSVFSFFKVKPIIHYQTDHFDKKVGLFWTGLMVIIALILVSYIYFF